MGDLNIRGALAAEIAGWPDLIHEPTYPRDRPRLALDHVLVSDDVAGGEVDVDGGAFQVAVVDLEISDHRAVVVDVDI
jgi:endonuclease/exonuclease/phosphatase family metal-dependent hydrolase